jgi:phosphopantothenoylcysteine decarboxylase/phosphopantothenate--cysteine ligase
MGFALAQRAVARGARVTIVAGTTTAEPPSGGRLVRALSADEMFEAVKVETSGATVFIGAAAVSDYRPRAEAATKIKKEDKELLTLELERTQDILSFVSGNRHPGLIVAGFAAETESVEEYAKSKLEKKKLDLVVANDVTKKGAGFNTDTNIATIFVSGREEGITFPLMLKTELADRILDEIAVLRRERLNK